MYNFKLLTIISAVLSLSQAQFSCEFNITDIPPNEPVYLEKNPNGTFKFLQPTNQMTVLPYNKEITLLCPVAGNFFVDETVSIKTLRCKGGKTFTDVDLKLDVAISSLACGKNVVADYQTTFDTCAEGVGRIYLLGFKINGGFVKQIEVCFDDAKATALYSRHIINGLAMKYSIKESARRGFLSSGIYVKPYNLYTQTKQTDVFLSVFNIVPASDMYFLSRGHLSPDADFIFTSGQFATYFYLNVMPEFQIINQGNWLRVERLARNVAIAAGKDIDVITGGQELLYYRHTTTNLEYPFYLDPIGKFIEVPKFIYKILINEREKTSIVLVTCNDPYLKTAPQDFCPNICTTTGLTYPGVLQDFDKGYTICCSLPSFKKIATNLPALPDYVTMNLKGIIY